MKKKVAIIVTLLASFIWLFSAILPHHHHNDEICLATSHSNSDCEDHAEACTDHEHHEGERTGHDHQQQDGEEDEHCVLDQMLVTPGTDNKRELNPDYTHYDKLYNYTYKAISDDSCQELSPPSKKYKRKRQHPSSFYDNIVSRNLGLRGPPVI
jgi:hypothetical protein